MIPVKEKDTKFGVKSSKAAVLCSDSFRVFKDDEITVTCDVLSEKYISNELKLGAPEKSNRRSGGGVTLFEDTDKCFNEGNMCRLSHSQV